MRQSSVLFVVLGAVGLAGFLSACSGGGSPSASASAGGASGSGSASASGTVTGFGSIIVNGKRFETEGAFVSVDGQPSSQCTVSPANRCGLQEGMTVKVSGSFNGSTNRAASIAQEDTLEGPITNVDAANSQFAVLGQTVLVDDTTKFDSGLNLAALVVGNVVEVSGFVKSDGVIAASFIERKPGTGCSPVCEVKGTVRNHNAVLATFQIGGLTVNYDNNTIISEMPVPSGSNWNGLFVELKGTTLAGLTLTATQVEPEHDGADNGNVVDKFEVEGFVTQAGTPNGNIIDFAIGTTPVRTTANTEFRGGTVDEIMVGAKMSAEGRFDGSTLIAKHVKFHESVRLEGDIETIGTNSFTIKGLPGITVTVNRQTEFKANGGATINNLSDLAINNHVRVRGRVSGANSVIATRIQLRSSANAVDLQGPVQAVSDPTLTILGVTVDTTGVTQFEGIDGGSMNRAGYFAAVQVGTLVRVKGTLIGTVVTWDEAELED
jgi:cytoskeletal protein CcmA (bactofilin family)